MYAADARRQDVGDGLSLGVLLDVDGADLHRTRLGAGAGLKVLLVLSPLSAHEVQASEAQCDGLLESGEEHSHEADAGEVVDAAHLPLPFCQGYAVLVPAHGERVVVAQLGVVVAVVDDIGVLALLSAVVGLQLVVADGDAVLVVALVLVEGIVLVDVLDVGSRLVGGVVRLGLVVGRG